MHCFVARRTLLLQLDSVTSQRSMQALCRAVADESSVWVAAATVAGVDASESPNVLDAAIESTAISIMRRKIFITTVRKGLFVAPPS